MCGEWFYIDEGEEIAIFSAEHDKFITLSYDDVAKYDVRYKQKDDDSGEVGETPQDGVKALPNKPPILIFRPFQTVSVQPKKNILPYSHMSHLIYSYSSFHTFSGQWLRVFCSKLDRSSATHFVSARTHYVIGTHLFLTLFSNLPPSLYTQTGTTTCSCRT